MENSFERSLKPLFLEEVVDYYFYRRVAHRLVPSLLFFKLSPNQISLASMLTGLTGAWFVLHQQFLLGALFAMSAIFLDCCDGQIARLTGQTSPLGRVTDGFCDLIWISGFWLAIHFSGYFLSQGMDALWLMIAASASMILHCWRFDGIRQQYFRLVDPKKCETDLNMEEIKGWIVQEFKKFNLIAVFLSVCLAIHTTVFVSKSQKVPDLAGREKIRAILQPEMARWPWLGESHHNTPVILGILLASLSPYPLIAAFWLILMPMNIYWFYLEWRWAKAMQLVNLPVPKMI